MSWNKAVMEVIRRDRKRLVIQKRSADKTTRDGAAYIARREREIEALDTLRDTGPGALELLMEDDSNG